MLWIVVLTRSPPELRCLRAPPSYRHKQQHKCGACATPYFFLCLARAPYVTKRGCGTVGYVVLFNVFNKWISIKLEMKFQNFFCLIGTKCIGFIFISIMNSVLLCIHFFSILFTFSSSSILVSKCSLCQPSKIVSPINFNQNFSSGSIILLFAYYIVSKQVQNLVTRVQQSVSNQNNCSFSDHSRSVYLNHCFSAWHKRNKKK